MKNKISILLTVFICAFLCASKVNAEVENQSSGVIYKNTKECNGKNCIVGNNSNYLIVQARLNYLNRSSFENIGKTYYFVNTSAYNYLKNYDINLIEITAFNSYTGTDRYQKAINYLNTSYLNNATKGKDMLNKLIGFNDYTSVLIKDIDRTPKSTQGYRILLEPALVISNIMNKTNTALVSAKGLASIETTELKNKLGTTYFDQVMKIYDTTTSDSNSSLFQRTETECRNFNNQTLADYSVKCLYIMYNVDDYISPSGSYTCYKKNITQDGEYKCSNWDKNNDVSFTENYTSYACKTTVAERKRTNIYGKTILETIGTCRLYCKEKATVSLPGNISISKQKGTYFEWPTTKEGTNYRMSVKTTMECTIVDDGGGGTTTSPTMIRKCAAGTYNHPNDPDKCISNAVTQKVCDKRVTEQVGNVCYTLVNATSTQAKNIDVQTPICNPNTQYTLGGKCYTKQAYKTCPSGSVERDLNGDGIKECYGLANVTSCPGGKIVNGKCYKYSSVNSCKNGFAKIKGSDGYYKCYNTKSYDACGGSYWYDYMGVCIKKTNSVLTCPAGKSLIWGASAQQLPKQEYNYRCVTVEGNSYNRTGQWPETAARYSSSTGGYYSCPTNYQGVWRSGDTCYANLWTTEAYCGGGTSYAGYYWSYSYRSSSCTYAGRTKTGQGCCTYYKGATWHSGSTTWGNCPDYYHATGDIAVCEVNGDVGCNRSSDKSYDDNKWNVGGQSYCRSYCPGDRWQYHPTLYGNQTESSFGYCVSNPEYPSCNPIDGVPAGWLESEKTCYALKNKDGCSGNWTTYLAPGGKCREVTHTTNAAYVSCPGGKLDSNGLCLSNSYSQGGCPSGYTYDSASGKCRTNTTTSCNAGYILSGQKDRYCRTAAEQPKTYCANYGTGYTYKNNRCEKTVPDYCGTQTNKNYEYVTISGKKMCCPSGSVKSTTVSTKCRSTSQKQNKICPYSDPNKKYYTPDNSSTSVCRLISVKNNIEYKCPEGFSASGTTCVNDCTADVKENFRTRMKQKLENPSLYALVNVDGSTSQINDPLVVDTNSVVDKGTTTQNGQLKSFTFDTITYLKTANDKNRYYNKTTGETSNTFKNGFYDRGSSVISLPNNIKSLTSSNAVNNYKLIIKDLKNIGADNSFDEYVKNQKYTCDYRVSDKKECKCMEGTKNAGDSAYELYAGIIYATTGKKISANTDVTYSCTDLQKTYCNYDIKDKDIYCTNCSNNKVNMTACISNKLSTMTFEKAYNACNEEVCEASKCNNYCTKNCRYIDKKIGKTIYSVQKCNGDSEICNFELRCVDDIETSQSYVDLLSQRLNTTNIVKKYKSLTTADVETAIMQLDSSICGIREKSKVIYRLVDLNNPFLSKGGNKRQAGDNWNSTDVINETIKSGRGVSGDQIYNKEPLFTITLTPNSIQKIREYNKEHKYADNRLTCNGDDASGCISSFIHGNTDSLKEMGILSGINSCTSLSTNSSLSSFESCYVENN